ncbi:hypothetical protein [Aneurinibacillus tyrosinisolvens]|jgi:hypothetical protein|nr:hypothetical protein [Aneurinibacillus tyrosinisolvens]
MNEKPKGARGPGPIIIPRHISQWIKDSSSIGRVNANKVGGGRPSWNGKK